MSVPTLALRGPAPKCNPAGSAFRSTTPRDGYIRSARKCVDAVYDVPGAFHQAAAKGNRGPSAAFRSSTPRDGFTKQFRHINVNVTCNVPGMADEVARSRKGAWAKPPKDGGRDSYIREIDGRFVDAVYDVPGIADSWKTSRNRGTAAFRSSSVRDGHVKVNRGRFIDVYYDTPGIGSPSRWFSPCPASSAFKGSSTPRDSYISDAKCHMNDVTVNVKGMAEEILRSPKGRFPREGKTEGRDGYIRAAHKTADLVYDVPGMADVSRSRSVSPSAAFRPGPSDRDSYIKAERKLVDAFYDLPSMADLSPMSMSFASNGCRG